MNTVNSQQMIYRRKPDEDHNRKLEALLKGMAGIAAGTTAMPLVKLFEEGVSFEDNCLIAKVHGEQTKYKVTDDALSDIISTLNVSYLNQVLNGLANDKEIRRSGFDETAFSLVQSRVLNAILLFKTRYVDGSKNMIIQKDQLERIVFTHNIGSSVPVIKDFVENNPSACLWSYTYRNHDILITFTTEGFDSPYGRSIANGTQLSVSDFAVFTDSSAKPVLIDEKSHAVIATDTDTFGYMKWACENKPTAPMRSKIMKFLVPKISKAKAELVMSKELSADKKTQPTLWEIICAISNLGYVFDQKAKQSIGKSSYPTPLEQEGFRSLAKEVLVTWSKLRGTEEAEAAPVVVAEPVEVPQEVSEETDVS